MKKINCIEEITLSNEDIKALELMEDFLSGGAGALISCSCKTTEEKKKDDKDNGN